MYHGHGATRGRNQKHILRKGSNYTTTLNRNIIESKPDLTRKLRLREPFSSEEQEIENKVDTSLAKANSSFYSPRNKNACVDKTIEKPNKGGCDV